MLIDGIFQLVVLLIHQIGGANHIQNNRFAADGFDGLESGYKTVTILFIAPSDINNLFHGRWPAGSHKANRHKRGNDSA